MQNKTKENKFNRTTLSPRTHNPTARQTPRTDKNVSTPTTCTPVCPQLRRSQQPKTGSNPSVHQLTSKMWSVREMGYYRPQDTRQAVNPEDTAFRERSQARRTSRCMVSRTWNDPSYNHRDRKEKRGCLGLGRGVQMGSDCSWVQGFRGMEMPPN